MKNKIIQFIPALLALLAIGFRYFSNWCIDTFPSCYSSWVHHMYQYFTSPLLLFAFYFLPLAAILAFVPRKMFMSWLKFTAWSLPIAFIFIAGVQTGSGGFMNFFSFYRNDAARLAGKIFSVASFAVLAFGFIRSHLYAKNGGYNSEYVENEMREWKTLFATVVGLVSFAIFFPLSFSSSVSLEICALTGAIVIFAYLYAFYNACALSFRKRNQHIPFGGRMVTTLILLSIGLGSVAATIVAFVYGYF